ncbi:hypothetical protein BP6252_10270 [Coleophoma cylindrospora]|uniref:Integral membrane protein n=1 Tax=Coleophoma cylindrospora TaxID=1849047 RepID=A0A3D8QS28_9HELO|nr:hypothetical protein BP6252_10270 [Coleophoma cylindrospora]
MAAGGLFQRAEGPIAPTTAILGGVPTMQVDVPITAICLIFFVFGAITHLRLHRLNSKRGHKFHLSDMVFDFCMVRNITCVMRLAWATQPTNNSIIVAALIFENAGVVVLFAVNAVLAQRVLRALHPNFGWRPIVGVFFTGILISVPVIIIWNIVNLTLSYFAIGPETTHDFLLFGSAYTTFLSLLPIFIIIGGLSAPSAVLIEDFGTGSFIAKVLILLLASSLLVAGTLTRLIGALVLYPFDAPGKVDSKVLFYITGFLLEIIVVYLYAILRIDLRFHIPDGSRGPGDYSGMNVVETVETSDTATSNGDATSLQSLVSRSSSIATK